MNDERRGDWAQTFTGRRFWPIDPRPEDVTIEDIAHALSLVCRFGGHCREFYSVAQHSVLVSASVPEEDALHGLLHDAAEAYVGDMVRPLKRSMSAFEHAECLVFVAITERFGLVPGLPASVKVADNRVLMTEKRDLMNECAGRWQPLGEPLAERIVPLSPRDAERSFLARFEELRRT